MTVEIHQILTGAAYGDAITNEALRLRDMFRKVGPSEIYSYHHDRVVKGVHQLADYRPGEGARVLLVHHSIGEPAVAAFLARRTEPMVLRYHNITPPEFVEDLDPEVAALLARGRDELAELRPRVAGAIAVSGYNGQELEALGYQAPAVVPLVLDSARLTRVRPARPRAGLPARGNGPVILFVGRITPNKSQHLLLQAFHVLKRYLRPDAHLVLAGRLDQPLYVATLERFTHELGLEGVAFTDQVSDRELAAIYRRADVFCCLSAHEGFGAPLVEAMAFDVPIVAWDTSAVGDTVGDAALKLPEPSPALVAEALGRVLTDDGLRGELVRRGRARLRAYDPEAASRRVLDEVLKATA